LVPLVAQLHLKPAGDDEERLIDGNVLMQHRPGVESQGPSVNSQALSRPPLSSEQSLNGSMASSRREPAGASTKGSERCFIVLSFSSTSGRGS
jgi:hypothetical protein